MQALPPENDYFDERKSTGRTRAVLIGVALLLLAVVAYFLYTNVKRWHRGEVESAVREEQKYWQVKTEDLEHEISSLHEEITELKGQGLPEKKLVEVFGEETAAPGTPPGTRPRFSPGELDRKVMAFFAYLDNQPYVQAYELEGGSYSAYLQAVEDLSANQPKVSGELDSLYTMIRNVAHFYRVLGKNRVNLTKEILANESEIVESVMNTFYQWYTLEPAQRSSMAGRPGDEVLYEYAGFFLNTLGGRSYLARRAPRVRVLTHYYSVLLLDRANDEKMNANGIDIRPHIRSAYNDIKLQMGLFYQKLYLEQLEKLMRKYQI
jgi:hypothetical protein